MIMAYKIVDLTIGNTKSNFTYFSSFENPCYGFNVEIDITMLYKLSKERGDSIFINLLYIIHKGMEEIEQFRYRILGGDVVLFDKVNPAWTVMTDLGIFDNVSADSGNSYKEFYANCKKAHDEAKKEEHIKDVYNDSNLFNQFYFTCIPWLDYASMTHPIPSNDPSSYSVPRVCWGKFHDVNGRMKTMLNITVSHALIDGHTLCKAFNNIQNKLDNCENFIKD